MFTLIWCTPVIADLKLCIETPWNTFFIDSESNVSNLKANYHNEHNSKFTTSRKKLYELSKYEKNKRGFARYYVKIICAYAIFALLSFYFLALRASIFFILFYSFCIFFFHSQFFHSNSLNLFTLLLSSYCSEL